MEIPSEYLIGNRLATQAAANAGRTDALGRDAFMKLLVSQLSNQDPLSPLQDHEFVSQLATFSSLEQLEGINQGIQVTVLMNQAVNNSLATNLIGKEVMVSGGSLELGEEGDAGFRLDLAGDARVTVEITDGNGAVVRTIDLGAKSKGSSDVAWDGKDDDGDRLAAGTYRVKVTATDTTGTAVAASTRVRALVEGVRFVEGVGYLVVGGAEVPLSDVEEVLAPIGG